MKSRKDAKGFAAIGLGNLDDPEPVLDADEQTALQCWHFCNGWFPERIPIYEAIYGVSDHEKLVELMMTIRDGN